jgi:hypothetical protein
MRSQELPKPVVLGVLFFTAAFLCVTQEAQAQTYDPAILQQYKAQTDLGYKDEVERMEENRAPQYPLDSDCASGDAGKQLGGASNCSGGGGSADATPMMPIMQDQRMGSTPAPLENRVLREPQKIAAPNDTVASCKIGENDPSMALAAMSGKDNRSPVTDQEVRPNAYAAAFYNGLIYEREPHKTSILARLVAADASALTGALTSALPSVVTQAFQKIMGAGTGKSNVESACKSNKNEKGICAGTQANSDVAQQGYNNQKASWQRKREGAGSVGQAKPTKKGNQNPMNPGRDPQASDKCGTVEAAINSGCKG